MESFKVLPTGYCILISDYWLKIEIKNQKAILYQGFNKVRKWPVSTSKFGTGNRDGSFKTPLGWHVADSWIGEGCPIYTIFKARVPTEGLCEVNTNTDEDVICTRIVWLRGIEQGLNAGEGIDSYLRYIYIHGTNDEKRLGKPASRGCIRMGNQDSIELFNYKKDTMLVSIEE